jgi:glucose/arabinose dehydrogenase
MRYLLPAGIEPSPVVLYHGSLIPAFQGNLLMAGGDGGGLLRVRFDASDPLKAISSERLFEHEAGKIRAIAAAPDGAIYLATSTALMRVVPAAAGDAPVTARPATTK